MEYNEIKATNVSPVKEEPKNVPKERPESNFDTTQLVEPKKPSLMRRLVKSVAGEQSMGNIRNYVIHEIVVPSIKNTIASSLKSAIDMFFLGGGSYYNQTSYGSPRTTQRTNYNTYSRYVQEPSFNDGPGSRFDTYEEVEYNLFRTRESAQYVLQQLREEIDLFGEARLSSYYSVIKRSKGRPYTDQNYRWRDLSRTQIIQADRGYWTIVFPPLEEV